MLSVVYGSLNDMLRDKLCDNLSSPRLNFDGPLLFIKDYNAVTSSEEASLKGSLAHYHCGKFLDWIFEQSLVDLGFSGSNYTCFRGLNSSTFKVARLDRGIYNVEWRDMFYNASLTIFPKAQSDHVPLLVSLNQ